MMIDSTTQTLECSSVFVLEANRGLRLGEWEAGQRYGG